MNSRRKEDELGMPEWLARVEDVIFSGLPNDEAKQWPTRLLNSISVGQDLDKVKAPFIIFVLETNLDTLMSVDITDYPMADFIVDNAKRATRDIISLWSSGTSKAETWHAYEKKADVAEAIALSASMTALTGVDMSATAADTAACVARSAKLAARVGNNPSAVAEAVWCSARSVELSSNSVVHFTVSDSNSADSEAIYVRYADKLIELIVNTKQ